MDQLEILALLFVAYALSAVVLDAVEEVAAVAVELETAAAVAAVAVVGFVLRKDKSIKIL